MAATRNGGWSAESRKAVGLLLGARYTRVYLESDTGFSATQVRIIKRVPPWRRRWERGWQTAEVFGIVLGTKEHIQARTERHLKLCEDAAHADLSYVVQNLRHLVEKTL